MTATVTEPAGSCDAAEADRPLQRPSLAPAVALMAAAFLVVTVIAVGLGAVSVPPGVTTRILVHHLLPSLVEVDWTPAQDQIIWQFRLPRTLLAASVGAGLSIVGATLQAVVRNPLADPFLLGVSSGAGVGAVLVIALGSTAVGGLTLSAAAFAGGCVATGAVLVLSRRRGELSPSRLILAGVALSYLFSSVTSFLTLTTQAQDVFSVMFFLLGSVAAATWSDVAVPAVVTVALTGYLLTNARALNALLVGDETATSLGVAVDAFRTRMLIVTALLTGIMVSVAGGIGFVGLVVPHVARLLVGSDHRRMLPVTAIGGATFLVLIDLVSRTVAAPRELPIGIVTAAVGAPFFLWLMRRRDPAAGVAR